MLNRKLKDIDREQLLDATAAKIRRSLPYGRIIPSKRIWLLFSCESNENEMKEKTELWRQIRGTKSEL